MVLAAPIVKLAKSESFFLLSSIPRKGSECQHSSPMLTWINHNCQRDGIFSLSLSFPKQEYEVIICIQVAYLKGDPGDYCKEWRNKIGERGA